MIAPMQHPNPIPAATLQAILAHDRRPMRDRGLEGVIAARAAADFVFELVHGNTAIPGLEVLFHDEIPDDLLT
jgi:hypothetical protein